MDPYSIVGTWVAAIITLMALSFLYKENPLFRIAENLMVGLGTGYYAAWGLKNVNDIAATAIQRGEYAYVVPILVGSLFYLRLSSKYAWLSRWAVALLIGVATALSMRGAIDVQFISQILTTGSILASNPLTSFNNLLIAVLCVCTICYFLYSREQKGPLGVMSKIGRYGMMIAFGASFAGVIVSRVATMIGVIQFLLEWLGIHH